MVTFPPGTIKILLGSTSVFRLLSISSQTASLNSNKPFAGVYPCLPSFKALTAASTICLGVLKSGCPIPKLIIFFPSFLSLSAFPKITKAFSVPKFNKFGLIVSLLFKKKKKTIIY